VSIRNAAEIARRNDFKRYKKVIAAGQRSFVEVGTALGLIRKGELFKEDGFDTFEAFVEGACDMSRAHAYRLVDAARVLTILSPLETYADRIRNEAQARQLVPLGKDRDAMIAVIDAADSRPGRLTAALLAEVRQEMYPHVPVIEGELVPDAPGLGPADRPAIEAPKTAADDTPPEVPADGGEGALTAPEDPSASGPVPTAGGDGPGVTLVHVAAKLRPAGAPQCFVIDEEHPTTDLLDVGCPTCQAWLLSPGGVAWARGKGLKYSSAAEHPLPGALVAEQPGPELVGEHDLKAAQWARERLAELELPQTGHRKQKQIDHLSDYVHGSDVWCRAFAEGDGTVVGVKMATCRPCLEALIDSSSGSETDEAPAGIESSLTEGPAVVTSRPGIEPPLAGGEAPVHASVPAAGETPQVDDGDGVDRDEVEGEAGHSPSTDPASVFMAEHRRQRAWVDGWDFDVIGPMLTVAEMTEVEQDHKERGERIALLKRWGQA
jgi:hypothetical protein